MTDAAQNARFDWLEPAGSGKALSRWTVLEGLDGLGVLAGDKAMGRPVGEIARVGPLPVADDVGNTVWRVSRGNRVLHGAAIGGHLRRMTIESHLHRARLLPARRLVVIVHGFRTRLEDMQAVLAAVRESCPSADIYLPRLRHGGRNPFMTGNPSEIAGDLVDDIDTLWSAPGAAYKDIVLVGYSAGSMIVRKIAILAHGAKKVAEVPFEPAIDRFGTERPWAKDISRIVLLAGMTRGWTTNSALDWVTSALWSAGAFVGETVLRGRAFMLALRAGSPFMVQTRLQWLALSQAGLAPVVVQLLGTIDDFVSPEDNVDLLIDELGERFFLIEVPGTGHLSILEMKQRGTWSYENKRWRAFRKALTKPDETLQRLSIPAAHLADNLPPGRDKTVTDVVFVIHGIRDRGFWTQKIAREIKRVSEASIASSGPSRVVVSMTASYGYFAMAPFVLRWIRARKVAWLMDRYTEARARYPQAAFSYVGHSNGTYLVAGALRDYPAARFRHVVLAGSVVRTDFGWRGYLEDNRLEGLMNYVATGDLVVAGLPKGFQRLGWFDLGGGGHDGFRDLASDRNDGKPWYEIRYVSGGHGAGVKESQWDEIANFVVHGSAPKAEDNDDYKPSRARWFDWLFALQPLPLLLGVAAVLGLLAILLILPAYLIGALWPLWPASFVVAIILYIVLTKF